MTAGVLHTENDAKIFQFFAVDRNFYCSKNVDELFVVVDIDYDPSKWRLFINSFSRSLKSVLFHNGSVHPSFLIVYSAPMNVAYKVLETFFAKLPMKNQFVHVE